MRAKFQDEYDALTKDEKDFYHQWLVNKKASQVVTTQKTGKLAQSDVSAVLHSV